MSKNKNIVVAVGAFCVVGLQCTNKRQVTRDKRQMEKWKKFLFFTTLGFDAFAKYVFRFLIVQMVKNQQEKETLGL